MRWPSITHGVRQHPVLLFYVLACGLAWWPWPLYAAGMAPSPIVGCGPFLAAIIVLAITEGRAGVGALLRRMVQWRVAPRWYAVALLLPIALSSASAGLNVLLGVAAPSPARLATWTGLFGTFAVFLLVPGIGGAWEEPGWRGYALPKLQAQHSALTASVILGLLWVPWHLPLFLNGTIPVSDAAMLVAQAVVFTWVFNSSGGSVLLLTLLPRMA